VLVSGAARIQMARLARIDGRLAELSAEQANLLAERARVFDELGRGEVSLPALRKEARRREPTIPEPTELDRARAQKILATNGLRRRVGR
jgi:hypothetical protein